jgi:hypothetical protein
MITSGRDGKVAYWNVKDNFKLISNLQVSQIGVNEEEINAIQYVNVKEGAVSHPFLVMGGTTGGLSVLDVKT